MDSAAPPGGELDGQPSQRERIYAAALVCFARHGIQRTGMEDIAREAGVSRPAIYYYFENKQALIQETVIREQAEAHRRHWKQVAGNYSGLEAVLVAATLAVEHAMSDPFVALLTRPDSERLTAAALRSETAREVQHAFWEPMLAEARARGELRADLSDEEVVRWIVFLQFGMVVNRDLFGFDEPGAVREDLERFLIPALSS